MPSREVKEHLQEQELGQGTSDSRRIQANRDGRQAKKRQTLGHRASAPSSSGKGAGGGRGRGKGKSKDQSGLELCYSWASGKGHCADGAPEGSVRGPLSGSISAAFVFHHRRRMRVAGLDAPWDWQTKVHADLLLAGSSAWGSDHVQNVFHKFIRSLFWSLVEGRRAVVAVNALGFRVECIATGCSFCVGLQGASLLGNLTVVCPATLA